jgi:heme/copper-type cytochrome/quinol oxidase subunit 2
MDQMDQMDQLDRAKAINHEHIAGNLIMALIVVFVPVLGHIILTAIILRDDLKFWEKVAWIVVIWVVWWVGPFLYLLLGQRRNRLLNFF